MADPGLTDAVGLELRDATSVASAKSTSHGLGVGPDQNLPTTRPGTSPQVTEEQGHPGLPQH